MILRMCYNKGPLVWGSLIIRTITMNPLENNLAVFCKHLSVSESEGKYLYLKHPTVKGLSEEKIQSLIGTLHELGLPKSVLLEEPSLFCILPITLKFRYKVLQECGISVTPRILASYLKLLKQKTIGELKHSKIIHNTVNVENRLASYMTQWPTSLTTLVYGDVSTTTLYSLRLKIIQRYLELVLDLTEEEFYRGVQTYATIKHRPLEYINETLAILQSEVMMPIQKIKSNLYLVHIDPENLKNIVYNLRSIGGVDIRDILRMYPKIAVKSYSTMLKTQQVLEEYGISKEAQTRCFEIYTLGPDTVRQRIEKAKEIPEFNTYFDHPRFLKMIYYNNKAIKRLKHLYDNNKKCLSLNILSGSTAHYETFEKAPGDRLGKGKDLVFCVRQCLGSKFSSSDIRNVLKRHPFWINIPLIQVKYVYEKLSNDFTAKDIYENCPILLYPWSKIRDTTNSLKLNHKFYHYCPDHIDLTKLNNSQRLSLILYLLEKQHYFTGNGVWTEEKYKNNSYFNNKAINECEITV